MKANELRIGNLIYYFTEGVYVVNEVNSGTITWAATDEIMFKKIFEPIPLTEEWLLKAGFEKDETDWWYIDDFGVKRYDDDCFVFYTLNTIIKFLHQLQNIYFALTGEELTIKQ